MFLLSPQLPRDRAPLVTNIPELGVVSSHQKDDWLCHNDNQQQQESACLSPHQLTSRSPRDTDDSEVHVFAHPEDAFSKYGEESEEEVMLHMDWTVLSIKLKYWTVENLLKLARGAVCGNVTIEQVSLQASGNVDHVMDAKQNKIIEMSHE